MGWRRVEDEIDPTRDKENRRFRFPVMTSLMLAPLRQPAQKGLREGARLSLPLHCSSSPLALPPDLLTLWLHGIQTLPCMPTCASICAIFAHTISVWLTQHCLYRMCMEYTFALLGRSMKKNPLIWLNVLSFSNQLPYLHACIFKQIALKASGLTFQVSSDFAGKWLIQASDPRRTCLHGNKCQST